MGVPEISNAWVAIMVPVNGSVSENNKVFWRVCLCMERRWWEIVLIVLLHLGDLAVS
jgi:hypothetical protein